jgi:hypothetical protein
MTPPSTPGRTQRNRPDTPGTTKRTVKPPVENKVENKMLFAVRSSILKDAIEEEKKALKEAEEKQAAMEKAEEKKAALKKAEEQIRIESPTTVIVVLDAYEEN